MVGWNFFSFVIIHWIFFITHARKVPLFVFWQTMCKTFCSYFFQTYLARSYFRVHLSGTVAMSPHTIYRYGNFCAFVTKGTVRYMYKKRSPDGGWEVDITRLQLVLLSTLHTDTVCTYHRQYSPSACAAVYTLPARAANVTTIAERPIFRTSIVKYCFRTSIEEHYRCHINYFKMFSHLGSLFSSLKNEHKGSNFEYVFVATVHISLKKFHDDCAKKSCEFKKSTIHLKQVSKSASDYFRIIDLDMY